MQKKNKIVNGIQQKIASRKIKKNCLYLSVVIYDDLKLFTMKRPKINHTRTMYIVSIIWIKKKEINRFSVVTQSYTHIHRAMVFDKFL